METTRFAPSPTGFLHLGHAFSARLGFDAAQKARGRFLVRIEDIDPARCKPLFIDAALSDLHFLGLHFPPDVRRQSQHLDDYERALADLHRLGLLYPCFCTRAEISALAPQTDSEESFSLYPGRCRALSESEVQGRIDRGESYALRLNANRAEAWLRRAGAWPLDFVDERHGTIAVRIEEFGDVVLARKEIRASYHLAVVVDDALQNVTLVTRGDDLLGATHVHRVLQALLGLPPPRYAHHRLLLDATGRRLAKRRGSLSIRALRQQGLTAPQIWAQVGLTDPRKT